ncbi:MAG: hypothetical protein KF819_39025 [Labilithrix sp.]|nr:hypothetical protein [Labilithrix sp.]
MNTILILRAFALRLRKDVRGANFVEYMVLVALAIGAVAAGAKTLGDAMKSGTDTQKTNIAAGFVQK